MGQHGQGRVHGVWPPQSGTRDQGLDIPLGGHRLSSLTVEAPTGVTALQPLPTTFSILGAGCAISINLNTFLIF